MASLAELERPRCCNPPYHRLARRQWWRLISSVPLLLLGVACASTNLAPIGAGGQVFQPEDDEQRLWNRALEEQERLDKSGLLYADPELEGYVNELAQRLLPVEVKSQGLSIKVRVIQNPLLNAFALPNGTIYIHTGILARMDNEAQLAALLGHEITHATHRHLVKRFRDIQNKAAFMAALQVTLAGVPYGDLATLLGMVGTIASVYGYSRDHEREADFEGFKSLVGAGYDPNEAPKVFAHLQRNLDEDKKKREPFFFGTHPRLQERIDNFTDLLQTLYQREAGETWRLSNADVFLERTRRLLLNNAVLDLRIGRFNTAKAGIEKFMQQEPHHPQALYLLGEVRRQQGKPESVEQAIRAYEESMQRDPSFPDPHKGLGLLYYKQNQRERALQLFERYLALAPEAGDRGYIEQYVRTLKAGGNL